MVMMGNVPELLRVSVFSRKREAMKAVTPAPTVDEVFAIVSTQGVGAGIQRLDEGQLLEEPAPSPARALMGRLERDLIWNRNG